MLKEIPPEYFDQSKGTLKLLWEQEWRELGITQVNQDIELDGLLEHQYNCNTNLTLTYRAWAGNTTKSMSQNRIFSSSSESHT